MNENGVLDMINHKTNLNKIRSTAEMLLYIDIHPTEIDFIASHLFTNTFFTGIKIDGEFEMIDLHEEKNVDRWRATLKKMIDKSSLIDILMMMNSPYVLLFLKMIQGFVSPSDMGGALAFSWSMIENISTDCNVTSKEMVRLFSYAAKESLMTKAERKRLSELPDTVTVFRGVTNYNKKNRHALSWTLSRETADWFANRYHKGDGEIWELSVPKEHILCYFEGRSEDEVILDMHQLSKYIRVSGHA